MQRRPTFRYTCATCEEVHEGFPAVAYDEPSMYLAVPAEERRERCFKTSDLCAIDGKWFFVRCEMMLPIRDCPDQFHWGVWGSLSAANFRLYRQNYDVEERDHMGPFFSWLANALPGEEYGDTSEVACRMHVRSGNLRPLLVIQPQDHPLFHEQQAGIDYDKAVRLVRPFVRWHS